MSKDNFEKDFKQILKEDYQKHMTVTLADILGEDGMREYYEEKAARSRKKRQRIVMAVAASLVVLILPLAVLLLPMLSDYGVGASGSLLPPSSGYGGSGDLIMPDLRITYVDAISMDLYLPQELNGWQWKQDQYAVVDDSVVGVVRTYSKDDGRLYLYYSSEGYVQFTLENADTETVDGLTVRHTKDPLNFYATWSDGNAEYCLRAQLDFTVDELTAIVRGLK